MITYRKRGPMTRFQLPRRQRAEARTAVEHDARMQRLIDQYRAQAAVAGPDRGGEAPEDPAEGEGPHMT